GRVGESALGNTGVTPAVETDLHPRLHQLARIVIEVAADAVGAGARGVRARRAGGEAVVIGELVAVHARRGAVEAAERVVAYLRLHLADEAGAVPAEQPRQIG